MSETGLICQNQRPNPADYFGMDREQVVAKSIESNLKSLFKCCANLNDLILKGHVFGSVGFINPMCKLKVMKFKCHLTLICFNDLNDSGN
jgi:hypothetical protein